MPKVKVEFEFDIPTEQEEFDELTQAGAIKSEVYEFSEYLRRKYKHTDPPNEGAQKEYTEIRDRFFELLGKYT